MEENVGVGLWKEKEGSWGKIIEDEEETEEEEGGGGGWKRWSREKE